MTLNNCDEYYDLVVSLYVYIYLRLCLGFGILNFLRDAAAPAAVAVGGVAATSLLAMPPLPMTLTSGVPPGRVLTA